MKTLILSLLASAAVASAGYSPRPAAINQSSVAITGGTINGTTTGATTPAAGTFTSLAFSGGAVTSIATITPGSSVAAALATGVGSAGAFVVNGGALGTPSSGVGTNITGVNAATLGGATFAAPGAIGGGTPGVATFSSTRILNSTLDANFVRENTANNGGGTVGLAELVLKAGISGSNVLALENTAADGYSALTCRDNGGNETFAIGYGNPSSPAPFTGINYIETWKLAAAPPDFAIFADGDYGATGSGFRRYKTADWAWSAADSVARFTVWHNIPIGTTQRRAFYVEVSGNVSSFAKIAVGSSDCSLQFWKDATPTKAIHYGLGAPGGAAGSDHLFYVFTGSAWVERMRIKNGASGTASLNLPGLPTSSAGLASGDVWSNLGILTIVP